MKRWVFGFFAAAALALPTAVEAQIAWDTPLLVAPREPDGWGIYLASVEGGDLGVIGSWRSPSWNFGLRGGLAEANGAGDDDLGLLFGIDFSGGIVRESRDFPLDVDWVFGAGLGTGNGVRFSAPLGLVAGHTFVAETARFTPYVSPRVVLDFFVDRDVPADVDDSEADLDLAIDLGLDLQLSSGFVIRFGGTLGDRDGVAIGLVF